MDNCIIREDTTLILFETLALIVYPVVSIIIPVYNVAQYLNECMKSVLDQSYTNWECILVDDGSNDESGSICDNWSEKDRRFRVLHQPNRGVSSARNVGLSAATGKYVVFIDSDDWVNDSYLSDMLEKADDNLDLVVSGIIIERNDRTVQICPPKEITLRMLYGTQPSDWVEFINLLYGPYVKLFKRSILCEYDLTFPEGQSLGEDMIFNLSYLDHSSDILFIPKADYHYRVAGTGSLSTMYRSDKFQIEYDLWKRRKLFFDEKELWNKELEDYMEVQLWGIVYNGVFNVKRPSMKYLKGVLGVPEISVLSQSSFKASPRIKKAIINRDCLFFYLLRRLKG